MITSEITINIFFFFSAVICIFFGSYSLYANPKAKLNIAFFAACLSLGIWSFNYGLFMHGTDGIASLIWIRVASIGHSLFYSFLLHFILILTKKDAFLKKWIFKFLMYLPAFICIYVFSISDNLISHQYIIVKTIYGFNTLPTYNIWERFSLIYFVSYTIICLLNVLYWGIKTNKEAQKKAANMIFWSFSISFILGSFIGIFANMIFSVQIPHIIPILIFLPMGIIFHAIHRYGFVHTNKTQNHEDILNYSTRVQVYKYLSITLIIISVFSMIIQFLYYEDIYKPIFSSGIILFLGLFIRLISILRINNSFKDIILVMVAFVAIPSITLIFLPFGSTAVWALSILFIIISLVFTKRMVLTAISVSVITTQIIIWILTPKEVLISINKFIYTGRICILALAIWLAFYVNRVYINRLEENKKQVKMQMLISEISADFISVSQPNFDEKIYGLVCKVGDIFNVDRCYVFTIDIENNTTSCISKWLNNKVFSNMQDISTKNYTWLLEFFKNNHIVKAEKLSDLPKEAKLLKEDLENLGVKSILLTPITGSSKMFGFIGIDSIRLNNEWSDEQIANLNIFNNIISDAFTRVEAEKEIHYMAYHDYLTGLPNRRLFNDRLNQAINLAKRTENIIGLIFIDLDSFKVINDTIGHEGGDLLLKTVSEKLVNIVRQSDTVSRFGGDEFIIMINNLSDDKDIIKISEKIMYIFRQPFKINDQEFYMTTSVGIAMYPFDGNEAHELIKNADIAMYKAKEKGKNQCFICSHELKEEIIQKIKITNSLHRALERKEFYLNYQPQVDINTGKIVGLEALIRWEHPEMGIIPPSVFIPIAEQAGLINKIGEWVLKTAYEQNKKWQINGFDRIRMAVNVSANQLRSHNLIEQIKQVLALTEIDPGFMELEITESAAMNETDYIVWLLSSIKSLGIQISIDDFGTNYSSLSRLKILPIDKLKIDKQFIDGIEESEKDKAIVRTIINLAKNMNVKVIAEGVETETQLNFLKEELCDEVQGYYYYKPMSVDNIEKILKSYK